MSFFDRLDTVCRQKGLLPSSQAVADLIGTTRATISIWHTRGLTPRGDTVAKAADVFGVSADYLLGRTNVQTDYTKISPAVMDMLADYQSRTIATRLTVDKVKALNETERKSAVIGALDDSEQQLLNGFAELDDISKAKLLAYLDGLKA